MKMNKKLKWIYILSASIYFTQGIEGMPSMALFAYLKEKLHFDPSTIMYLGSLTSLAWIIKPLWGYLCDNYMTKKKWIIISLLGSLITCFYLGLSPFIPLFILIPILMLSSANTAIRDVANDGIMCVEGKELNECDKIQTIQWTSITIASIIVSLLGGWIADHFSYQMGYLCLVPIYLLIIAIVLRYRTTVSKHSTREDSCIDCKFSVDCSLDENNICDSYQKRIIVQNHTMNCTKMYNILYKIIQSIKSYKELFTNKQFLLGALFIFIYNFAPGFGTPLFFIQRDIFKWSFTFMGIIGALSSLLGIVGAIIYFKISKLINVKKCLFWSVFFVGLTNLCYLYFTPVSAIVYSLIFGLLGMFIFLNLMTFMALSTLKGKEATSFALLCSINNLSGTCSTLVGAWLFPIIGLKTIIVIATASAFLSLPILKKLKIGDKNAQ